MKTFSQYITEEMDFSHPTFVRYGGLSSVPQDAYVAEPTNFHQPPVKRGVYAFVKGFVEPFLLGKETFDPRRQEFIRNKAGEIITTEHPDYKGTGYPDFKEHPGATGSVKLKNGQWALIKNKSPVNFKYDGPIWSHLEHRLKPHEIEQRKGSWVLTDMSTYIQALKKEVGAYKMYRAQKGYDYTIDHMEVFIEKI